MFLWRTKGWPERITAELTVDKLLKIIQTGGSLSQCIMGVICIIECCLTIFLTIKDALLKCVCSNITILNK